MAAPEGIRLTTLYFVRHGRTALNIAGRVQGALDPPLDPQGRADAERAAERLGACGVALILCSPMLRARATAEILGARLAAPVRPAPGFAERVWGPYEGGARAARPAARDPPGAEPWDAFRRRTLAALAREITAEVAAVLIVAHSGTFRALTGRPPAAPGPEHGAAYRLLPDAARGWRASRLDGAAPPAFRRPR